MADLPCAGVDRMLRRFLPLSALSALARKEHLACREVSPLSDRHEATPDRARRQGDGAGDRSASGTGARSAPWSSARRNGQLRSYFLDGEALGKPDRATEPCHRSRRIRAIVSTPFIPQPPILIPGWAVCSQHKHGGQFWTPIPRLRGQNCTPNNTMALGRGAGAS